MIRNKAKCSASGCPIQANLECWCTGYETLWCEGHFNRHSASHGLDYDFNYIPYPASTASYGVAYSLPLHDTKETVLNFLVNENSAKQERKKNILESFAKNFQSSEIKLRRVIKELDSESEEIESLFNKILNTQSISNSENDPELTLLLLPPAKALNKIKEIIQEISISYNDTTIIPNQVQTNEKTIEYFLNCQLTAFSTHFFKIAEIIENSQNTLMNDKLLQVKLLISDLKWCIEADKNILQTELQKGKGDSQFHSINNDLKVKFSNLNLLEPKKRQKHENKNELFTVEGLNAKTIEIFNRVLDLKVEEDFRNTCLKYEEMSAISRISDSEVEAAYKKYLDAYSQIKSIYSFGYRANNRKGSTLHIWDIERGLNHNKEIQGTMDEGTCMAQLPDGGLFCFGSRTVIANLPPPAYQTPVKNFTIPNQYGAAHQQIYDPNIYGIAIIINLDSSIQALQSFTACYNSSATYFNKNVYCFGGHDGQKYLPLSAKFDLVAMNWIILAKMPVPDYLCHCIVVGRNILIAGCINPNLYRYSIDNNKFARIHHNFSGNMKKILVNGERLYLIELGGSIYESQLRDETYWNKIGDWDPDGLVRNLRSNFNTPIYCVYNRDAVFISGNIVFDMHSKRLETSDNWWYKYNQPIATNGPRYFNP